MYLLLSIRCKGLSLFFLLVFLFFCHTLCIVQRFNISLCDQQLLYFIFKQPILSIFLFFSDKISVCCLVKSFTFGSHFTPSSSKVTFAAFARFSYQWNIPSCYTLSLSISISIILFYYFCQKSYFDAHKHTNAWKNMKPTAIFKR